MTDLVEVGRTGRAHGVRGDLSLTLLTDVTARVAVGARLRIGDTWMTVAASRPAGQRWLVHFDGVDDRTAAERFQGQIVLAEPLAEREGLYVDQLIGASVVTVDGEQLGECVAVVDNPAHDLLELGSGVLVPMVFVVERRPDGTLVIDPPDGLLDL